MAKYKDIEITVAVNTDAINREMERVRHILDEARHPAHWREVVEELENGMRTGSVMGQGHEYFHAGFPTWIRVEEDFRGRNTLMTCEKCGETIHSITYRDKIEKNIEQIKDEVKNAIGYHIEEECFTIGEVPVHNGGRPIKLRELKKLRGRDLPVNLFDFPMQCEVWFDTDDREFNSRCRLCGAHVCTMVESEIEEMFVDSTVGETVDDFINKVRDAFSEHQRTCKIRKRDGLRHIRIGRRK